MARDRSIALKVRADVADAVRGLEDVGRAAGSVGDRSEEAGQKSQTLGQRVAQSAVDQRQSWQTVGTALTTYGAAITGVGALVLTTGINYNSLRQTATQALTAVTGSTEEASEQMRRLDQYGQNSWLMRDTLITAQQQMTGFGISTERVIPYMNALAEATAATGGTNQDFLEMSQIMGQIQSQGRITAEELRRFGVRGVDAASLIGDAMGLTAGEIREQITAGALDAETALDALAIGMTERYGGASDLVRQTWRGAVDDVMAAFRDISAVIASPLVDPEGGGLLVGLLNQASDLMFALRDLPGPILQVGGALTGLSGMAALAVGGFMLLAPRLVDTWRALDNLGRVGAAAKTTLSGIAPYVGRLAASGAAIGITAAAMGALMSAITRPGVARDAEELATHLDGVAEAGGRLSDVRIDDLMSEIGRLDFGAFEIAKIQADDLGDAVDRVLNPSVTDNLSAIVGSIIPGVTSYMEDYRDVLEAADAALVAMVEAGNIDGATALIDDLGLSAEQVAEVFPGAAAAMDDAGLSALDLADGLSEAEVAAEEARAEAEALQEAWRQMAISASESFGNVMDAYNAATESAREFSEDATASAQDWISALQEQIDAHHNWETNIIGATERARELLPRNMWDAADEMIDALIAGGMESADAAALLVSMTDDEFVELAGLARERGDQGGEAFADGVEGARTPEVDIDDLPARSGFEDLVDDFGGTTTDTNVDANVDLAELAVETTQSGWESTTTDTQLNADPTKAMQVFNSETGAWERTTTDTNLDLDANPSIRVFDRETGRWVRTTTDTMLDLDPAEAARRYGVLTDNWRTTTTTTNLAADDSSARSTVSGLRTTASARITVPVSADTSSARRSISALSGIRVTATATVRSGMATGGPVFGPGSETSDSIPAMLSTNEHVLSAREVRGLGGHGAVEQMRAMARAGVRAFADGGTPAYAARPSFSVPAPAVRVSAPSLTGVRVAIHVGGQRIEGVMEEIADGRIAESMSGTQRAQRALTGSVR